MAAMGSRAAEPARSAMTETPTEPSLDPSLRDAGRRLLAALDRAAAVQPIVASDVLVEPLARFATALLRMRVLPALTPGWADDDPVHVALCGGTNSGKSTVLNLLLGRAVAGMDVTARFSQHPEGFRPPALGVRFLDAYPTRFDGYERFVERHPPRQDDAALLREGHRRAVGVLDPAAAEDELAPPAASAHAVLWDAPDFSTEQATLWMGAVLDTVALGDVVLMTVTDESYADDRGALLLRLISSSGARLHLVANKLPSGSLLDDVARKLAAHWRATEALPRDRLHPLPLVAGNGPDARLRALLATDAASALRKAVADDTARGAGLKRTALRGAVAFLRERREELLRPLIDEVAAAGRWHAAVAEVTQQDLLNRYRREYLDGRRYAEFDRALLRLVELLEVPGIGKVVKVIGDVTRRPSQRVLSWLRGLAGGGGGPRPQPTEEEREALARLFEEWLAALQARAQLLLSRDERVLWRRVLEALDGEALQEDLVARFTAAYQSYRERLDGEIERRARSLYEDLERRPAALTALRSANLLANVAVTGGAVAAGGFGAPDLVIGPLVAGLVQNLFDHGLGMYVRGHEEGLKAYQLRAVAEIADQALREPVARLAGGGFDEAALTSVRADWEKVCAAAERVAKGRQP